MPEPIYIKATTHDYVSTAVAARAISAVAAKDLRVNALRQHAVGQGFVRAKGEEANWGMRSSWTPSKGETVTHEMHIESYTKGHDQACIAVLTMTSSKGKRVTKSETSTIYLTAPNGNFEKATEHYATAAGRVLLSRTWWSRFKKCIKANNCTSTCLKSLTSCSGTWTKFLACVAARCGSCYIHCAACATCNCGWCRWVPGVGCCKG